MTQVFLLKYAILMWLTWQENYKMVNIEASYRFLVLVFKLAKQTWYCFEKNYLEIYFGLYNNDEFCVFILQMEAI